MIADPLGSDERPRERDERLLKLTQAEILLNCSAKTLYRWRKSGLIQVLTLGNGAVRISMTEINRFKAGRTPLI